MILAYISCVFYVIFSVFMATFSQLQHFVFDYWLNAHTLWILPIEAHLIEG